MNYLIFDRPFTHGFTRKFPQADNSGATFKYISDFKYRDDFNLISRQYKYLRLAQESNSIIESTKEYFTLDFMIKEILARDRFLRSLPQELSIKLAQSAVLAIRDVLTIYKPDIVIGLPVDNYYLHILKLMCDQFKIYSLFPLQSFLPGRTRITRLGEWRKITEVDESLVEHYYNLLNNEVFKPITLSKHRNLSRLTFLYAKEIGKKLLFESLKLAKRDRYSFHYNCIFPNKHAITIQGPSNLFVYKKFADHKYVDQILNDSQTGLRQVVFLPLQFSPEASIDYFISSVDFVDYNKIIDTIVQNIPENVTLLVKEHPDIYGFRSSHFYDRFINTDKNIVIAPVDYPASDIVKRCSNIIVTGGASTGAEAMARGKSVLSVGGGYFCHSDMNQLQDISKLDQWAKLIPPKNEDIQIRLGTVRRILENTIEGSYKFVRPSRELAASNLKNIQNLFEFIKNDKVGCFD